MNKLTREEVYNIVNSERDYQEKMAIDPKRPDILPDFHMGDAISAVQYLIEDARKNWYVESDPYINTNKNLRKITSLCVKMMEKYGVENR